jgi:hypothetical protein
MRGYDDVGREFSHRNPADVYKHAWELIVTRSAAMGAGKANDGAKNAGEDTEEVENANGELENTNQGIDENKR